jgi:hypothetical protein
MDFDRRSTILGLASLAAAPPAWAVARRGRTDRFQAPGTGRGRSLGL